MRQAPILLWRMNIKGGYIDILADFFNSWMAGMCCSSTSGAKKQNIYFLARPMWICLFMLCFLHRIDEL